MLQIVSFNTSLPNQSKDQGGALNDDNTSSIQNQLLLVLLRKWCCPMTAAGDEEAGRGKTGRRPPRHGRKENVGVFATLVITDALLRTRDHYITRQWLTILLHTLAKSLNHELCSCQEIFFSFKECLAIFCAPDPVASLRESCRESWTFFPTSRAFITAYSPRVWGLRAHAMDTASATLASSRSHAIVRHNGTQHTPGAPQPQHSRRHCACQGVACFTKCVSKPRTS